MAGYRVQLSLWRSLGPSVLITALVWLFVLIALTVEPAQAQLSPGDLHQSHAFLEGVENCKQCHGSDRESLGENCLICHTPIAQQYEPGSGLHGRGEYDDCELCHVEHQGRAFDLIYFKDGIKSFDHALTGYRLEGKHAVVDCRPCHQLKNIGEPIKLTKGNVNLDRTFLGLAQHCISCHLDEHRGQLSLTCTQCHSFEAWRPAEGFNHTTTIYPLTGRHAGVKCEKCHFIIENSDASADTQYQKYAGIPSGQCSDCHKDPHAGRLGGDCSGCHTAEGWSQVSSAGFDHSKTRYPLEGRHTSVDCKKCHDNGSNDRESSFAVCLDCHRDFHDGAFAGLPGSACELCHTVAGFTPSLYTIDAHNLSPYPLAGAHLAIPCFECHVDPEKSSRTYVFEYSDTTCRQCHRDPHNGAVDKFMIEAGCESCHAVATWFTVSFDHNRTTFPLDGRHMVVACTSCHIQDNPDLIGFTGLPKVCASCHTDIHRNQFAVENQPDTAQTDCAGCHTSKNWRATGFDHSRDARFALDGAHQRVPCKDCHPIVGESDSQHTLYRPLAYRCIDCHEVNIVEGESES